MEAKSASFTGERTKNIRTDFPVNRGSYEG